MMINWLSRQNDKYVNSMPLSPSHRTGKLKSENEAINRRLLVYFNTIQLNKLWIFSTFLHTDDL